jgi:hypothetical protein
VLVERSVGGRTLRAHCDARHARRAESALTAFESVVAPGAQVRFGWSLLRLDEALHVTEPDFAAWPSDRWAPTIDVTLDVLEAQVRLLGRVDADADDVTFDQVLLAVPGALDDDAAFLRRVTPLAPEDSGWLVGRLADPEGLARADDLERVPIASLVKRRPSLLPTLVLPEGFIAIVQGHMVEQVLDGAGHPRLP